MYNRKSKASAILAIVTAVLFVGFMVLLPFLMTGAGDNYGFAAIFVVMFGILGYIPIYLSAVAFVIVALIFGIKMLKQQSREKLISYNVRMLITTCVLLPFLIIGVVVSAALIFAPGIGLVSTIYFAVLALAYIGGLAAQIVAIVLLKKSPEKEVAADTEEDE